MSKFWLGNVYLLISMLCGAASQIIFKALLNETGPMGLNWSFVQQISSYGIALRISAAVAMLVAAFFFWLMSLSRLDLSYAYAIACSSALFVAFFSVLFLNETVSAKMWAGTALIVLGTVLLVTSQ